MSAVCILSWARAHSHHFDGDLLICDEVASAHNLAKRALPQIAADLVCAIMRRPLVSSSSKLEAET